MAKSKNPSPPRPHPLAEIDFGKIDLSSLDLDHIDLTENPKTSPWQAMAGAGLLIASMAVILWVPTSQAYRSGELGSGVFFMLCIAAISVGLATGRFMWKLATDAAMRYAERMQRAPVLKKQAAPASAASRFANLAIAVGGAALIVYAQPAQGYLVAGSGYSTAWYIAAAGAIVVSIFAGRFILLQSQRPSPVRKPAAAPIRLPPWFKWVGLAVICALGLVTAFGEALFQINSRDGGFALGGLGLIVGISAAIWIGHFFDDSEQRLRQQARQRRGQ